MSPFVTTSPGAIRAPLPRGASSLRLAIVPIPYPRLPDGKPLRLLPMSAFPINDFVPNEVLVRILDFASDYLDRVGRRHCDTLQLATVCKEWHDLIFNSPQLWYHLHLDVSVDEGYDCKNLVAHLKRWFGRAGTLLLELSVEFRTAEDDDYTPTSNFFEYLAEVPMWRALRLDCVLDVTIPRLLMVAQGNGRKTPWPNMEELTIRSSPPFEGYSVFRNNQIFRVECSKIMPRIQEFKLITQSALESFSNFLHQYPMSNLTSLELDTFVREPTPHPFAPFQVPTYPFIVLLQVPQLV